MTAGQLPRVFFSAGLALATVALNAQSAAAQDAAEIVKRSVVTNALDWKAQPEYSHRECSVRSKIDAAGQVAAGQSKVYQVLMIDGSPCQRLVEINGQPLSRDQEQQEQAKFSRETQRRHDECARDRQARITKYQSSRAEQHLLMRQMVAAFNFRLVGEQTIDGVDCYILDATPNPAYQPPVEKARVLLGMKGRLWIDKQHYHWAKVQAEVISPVEFGLFVAKVKPGTRFELQQGPVGDVWLPKHFSESVNASVFGLYGLHSKEEEMYSDYQPTQPAGAKLTTIAASAHTLARAAAPAHSELAVR